jgi:large subunit ribosomal protein L23
MNQESLILGPCVTEKGTAASEQANQVVFRVQRAASKGAIRHTVERLFKVTVVKVRTANFLGKKRTRGRIVGQRPDWKKAYVTLKEGDRIEFFEGL